MKQIRTVLVAIALSAFCGAGCEAQVGERCDGFFKNSCKAPASCVKTPKAKVCAGSCGANDKCPEGQVCARTEFKGNPAFKVCVPKKFL
ncbi:MAG: hypothetical protein ABI333_05500 [bacterium]